MRNVWTVVGDDPDFAQGDKHKIDGYYYPMGGTAFSDDLTTPERLRDTAKYGGGRTIGIYMGHEWLPGYEPAQLAKAMSDEYKRCTLNGTINHTLKVMFNLERHEPDKIALTLEEWRRLRPNVNTSWSMEGNQGGWMGPVLASGTKPTAGSFVDRILKCRVRLVPQAFIFNMERRAEDAMLRNLTKRGFPEALVSIFYDAKALPHDWDGFAFTMGRLPA